MTELDTTLSKNEIISIAYRIYEKLGHSNIDTHGDGRQKIAVNLIKLGETLSTPTLVQNGKEILLAVPINQQYITAVQLLEFYGQFNDKQEELDHWLSLAQLILTDCIQTQPVTSVGGGIIPQKFLQTISDIGLESKFNSLFALTKEYIEHLPITIQPSNILSLAESIPLKNQLASKLIDEATNLLESDQFKRAQYYNLMTFETEFHIAIHYQHFPKIQQLIELILQPGDYTTQEAKAKSVLQLYQSLKDTSLIEEGKNMLESFLAAVFWRFENESWLHPSEKRLYSKNAFTIIQNIPDAFILPYQAQIKDILNDTGNDKLIGFFPLTKAIIFYKIKEYTFDTFLQSIQQVSQKIKHDVDANKEPRYHFADVQALLEYALEHDTAIWKSTYYHTFFAQKFKEAKISWENNDVDGFTKSLSRFHQMKLKPLIQIELDQDLQKDTDWIKQIYKGLSSIRAKHWIQGDPSLKLEFWTTYGEVLYQCDFNLPKSAHQNSISMLKRLVHVIAERPPSQYIHDPSNPTTLLWNLYLDYLILLIKLDNNLHKQSHIDFIEVLKEYQPSLVINICPALTQNGFMNSAKDFLANYYNNQIFSAISIRNPGNSFVSGPNGSYYYFYLKKASILRKAGSIQQAKFNLQKALRYSSKHQFHALHSPLFLEFLYLGMSEALYEALDLHFQKLNDSSRNMMGNMIFQSKSPLLAKTCPAEIQEDIWLQARHILVEGFTTTLSNLFNNPAKIINEATLFTICLYLSDLEQPELVKHYLDQILASIEHYIKINDLEIIASQMVFLLDLNQGHELAVLPPAEFERIILGNAMTIPSSMSVLDLRKVRDSMNTRIPNHLSRIYLRLSSLYEAIGKTEIADICRRNGSQFKPVSFDLRQPLQQVHLMAKIRHFMDNKQYDKLKETIDLLMERLESSKIKHTEQFDPYNTLLGLLVKLNPAI